jgi:hypothetical protein
MATDVMQPDEIPDKFWRYVTYQQDTGCWAWTGPVGGRSGYPTYGRRAAWKWAYTKMYGPILAWGIYPCLETCLGNPSCANPDHRLGTPIDQVKARHKCQCGDWHDPDIEQ